MKKKLLTVLLLLASASAYAEEAVNTASKHNFLVNLGYTHGGVAFGADYENAYHKTYGLGGYVRMYGDNKDTSQGDLTTFGIFIRPHFTRQSWDFYVSPGFGFVQEEIASDDESYFGPSMAVGLLYQVNYNMAVGFENFQIYGWFGDDKAVGQRSDEMLAKFRYSF